MATTLLDIGLARRLRWLLVFRVAIATLLLSLTVVGDIIAFPLRMVSVVLYVVVGVTYLVVFILGLLVRARVSPLIISAVHLATAVMGAVMVVQATGGIDSAFSFLYLLVILDGAIIGGRRIALVVASASALAYGGQLVLQLYGIFPAGLEVLPPPNRFISAVVVHLSAYFLMALLSGHLARLFQSAQEAVSSAQSDLRRAEAFHESVLESLPVGVLTVDRESRVRSANAAAGRILELSPVELVRVSDLAALRPFLDGNADHAEIDVEIGARPRALSLSRSPMAASEREAEGPREVVVLEDRTEIRALERDLRAQERLASIGQMAAAIAHELRNPLAAISGSVEILRDEAADSEHRRKLESIVLREIDRLNGLVTDLLVYARPSPVERSPLDLVALVRDLFSVMRGDPAWRDHALELDGPERLRASIDPGQVRQMLWNLLRNAVDASPPGGQVVVKLASAVRDGTDGICIEVLDDGDGIAADVAADLFEPFRTTKAKGSGLGLAVVARIVEGHGGTVTLENAAPAGAIARVFLPRQ